MLEWLDEYTGLLQGVVDSPWLWGIVFVTAGLDALLPFMPSETTVVTAAVLIGPDPQRLALLTLLAATGAFAGDVGGHLIGRRAGPGVLRLLLRGERGRRRHAWARAEVERHAAVLIVAGRYLPGGRVVSSLCTGSVGFPVRRFMAYDAVGAALWAVLAVAIGAWGGAAFAERPAHGLLASCAVVLLVSVAVKCGRRHRAGACREPRAVRAAQVSTTVPKRMS
ncbi:DedA family protein [Streptomyces triticagri]|uniref:DedA family protein n=1 Tax=Streptomyces triticagri TaxID=2293568 RepID=A0A372M184_9ACTN|nr:VTT domain-containing protein [Streptomyces triticagri]RFU84678.1 DedA family protein [Streptomyces triticagri]